MGEKRIGLSRRNFIKGAGLAGVAASAAAILGNVRTPVAEAALDVNYISVYESVMGSSGRMYAKAAPCLGPAGPIGFEDRDISSSEIVETLDCDIVVVGAGITGMVAALKAADNGQQVIVLEKTSAGRGIFESFAAINAKVLTDVGYTLTEAEKVEFIRDIYEAAHWRLRRGPVHTFMERSGEAADFMDEMFQKGPNGIRTVPFGLDARHECRFTIPHMTLPAPAGRQGHYVVRELATVGKEKYSNLFSIRYLTPAVQLIREEDGPVQGVIAKDGRGYLRINARKGVILASGGYDANPEMMEAYCRSEDYTNFAWWNGHFGTTGDGHMMGMKAGASMDSVPHPIMSFHIAGRNSPFKFISTFNITVQNALTPIHVNSAGKRFVDESFLIGFTSYKVNAQGAQEDFGKNTWMISSSPFSSNNTPEILERYKAAGAYVEASSLAELATQCGIDFEGLRNTVDDWNSYCSNGLGSGGSGLDLEFGREITASNILGSGPFYAYKPSCGFMLATVGGLQIDKNCNVLDTNDKPIEGLYAGGNASGGFFYGHYPRHISGVSIGRAMTFGYVAADHASRR